MKELSNQEINQVAGGTFGLFSSLFGSTVQNTLPSSPLTGLVNTLFAIDNSIGQNELDLLGGILNLGGLTTSTNLGGLFTPITNLLTSVTGTTSGTGC